jgi:hypothetical protein
MFRREDAMGRAGPRLQLDAFGADFASRWYGLQRRFFKLETLQFYDETGNPSYDAFVAGDLARARSLLELEYSEPDPLSLWANEHNIEMRRVHIVSTPVSQYLWWEFLAYALAEAQGERIYVAASESVTGLDLGVEPFDFILLDSTIAYVNEYAHGKPDGAWILSDAAVIAQLSHFADAIMSACQPFRDFAESLRPGWLSEIGAAPPNMSST